MTISLSSSIEPRYRTIDDVKIRYAYTRGAARVDAAVTSPWPESIYAFAPMWATLSQHAHLASAYDLLSGMRAEAFAERARRELLATGEKVRKRDVSTQNDLTPQEEHIARLAREGRSNAEIGVELFLSVRTVEWHLRKVFMKLGIASRKDLKNALPAGGRNPAVTR